MVREKSKLSARMAMGFITFLCVALAAMSIGTREWRIEKNVPSKKMGLLSIEVHGCNAIGGLAGAAGGETAKRAAEVANIGCLAMAHEGEEGIMDWGTYQENTCRAASHSQACLADEAMQNMFDPTGYCHAIRKRCADLTNGIAISHATFGLILVGMIFQIMGGTYASVWTGYKSKAMCWSMFSAVCMLSAAMLYFGMADQYFKETSSRSTSDTGFAVYMISCSVALSLIQVFVGCTCLPADPEYDEDGYLLDDDEVAERNAKKKNKGSEEAAAQAQAQAAAQAQLQAQQAAMQGQAQQMADAKLMEIHWAIKQAGATNMEEAFRGFDTNGDGFITLEEFQTGITTLNIGLNPQQTEWLMGFVDKNRDGYVAYCEFADEMSRLETQQQGMAYSNEGQAVDYQNV